MLLEEKDQIGWSSVVVCGRISIGEKCEIKTMEDIKNYTKLL